MRQYGLGGNVTRRGLLGAWGFAGLAACSPGLALGPGPAAGTESDRPRVRRWPEQTSWQDEPPQHAVTTGTVPLDHGHLSYWDTGGDGAPLVLLHAATGSMLCWGYQQPVLAGAGYRVIGYSRRGHYGSELAPGDPAGSAAEDLLRLIDHLGIARCHLLGTAAGGFYVADFAVAHPERLLSLTIASSLAGLSDPDFTAVTRAMLPPGWPELPAEFRELGPSYRAANPKGTARWVHLEEMSIPGDPVRQERSGNVTRAALASLPVPILLMTGDADLYMPPARMRELAKALPNARLAIMGEAGHAAYWEQPVAFNAALLEFLDEAGDG